MKDAYKQIGYNDIFINSGKNYIEILNPLFSKQKDELVCHKFIKVYYFYMLHIFLKNFL